MKLEHKPLRATELYCTGNLFRHKVQRDRTKYRRKEKHRSASHGS